MHAVYLQHNGNVYTHTHDCVPMTPAACDGTVCSTKHKKWSQPLSFHRSRKANKNPTAWWLVFSNTVSVCHHLSAYFPTLLHMGLLIFGVDIPASKYKSTFVGFMYPTIDPQAWFSVVSNKSTCLISSILELCIH